LRERKQYRAAFSLSPLLANAVSFYSPKNIRCKAGTYQAIRKQKENEMKSTKQNNNNNDDDKIDRKAKGINKEDKYLQ